MIPSPLTFPFMPAETARRIAQRPVLWPALTLTCIAAIASLILRWPLVIDAAAHHLPAGATQEDRDAITALLRNELPFRCGILPMIVGVELAGFGLLVSILERFPAPLRSLKFKTVLVLCAHGAFLYVSGQLVVQLIGWSSLANHGLGIPGLAWIVGTERNYLLAALIRSANVLTLYCVTLLAVGLRVLFGGSALRSCLVAFAAWFVSILANLWLIRLMRDALHLSV